MRENHPRRRQALRALRKQEAKRGVLPRVLLGCEGATERCYFEGFRRAHGLPSLVLVCTGEGSDPRHLLAEVNREFAMQEGDFQEVFCVFDRDEHFHFLEICRRIRELGTLSFKRKKAPLAAIVSEPSFELWLLLHFEDVRAEVHRGETVRRLRIHCPGYEKADGKIYSQTAASLESATERARRLPAGNNPSTAAGELIGRLRGLWGL